jgi:hypothetical protein
MNVSAEEIQASERDVTSPLSTGHELPDPAEAV